MRGRVLCVMAACGLLLAYAVPTVSSAGGGSGAAPSSMVDSVRLWEAGVVRGVHGLAWSPDGSMLAVGDDSGNLSIYDSAGGGLLRRLSAHDGVVSSISWSSRGYIATGSYDDTVKVWDTGNWEVRATIENHTDKVWEVAWSPDGNVLATAGRDGRVYTFDPEGKPLAGMEVTVSGAARAITWEPAGDFLAGIVEDDFTKRPVLYKWASASGKSKKELRLNGTAFDAAWGPGGENISVSLSNGSILMVDADTLAPGRYMGPGGGAIYTLAWGTGANRDELLAGGDDRAIYVLNATSGTVSGSITSAHSDIITTLRVSPNGTMFASGGLDMRAVVWGDPAPHVVWHTPKGGAKDVPLDTNITIKFDKKMDENSLSRAITLSGASVNIVVRKDLNNSVAVIEPEGDLEPETVYTVTVGAGAKSLAGSTMGGEYTFTFTTASSPAQSFIDIPWLWVGAGAGALIFIIVIVLLLRRRRGRRVVRRRGRSEDEI